jgi:hypothetical protein
MKKMILMAFIGLSSSAFATCPNLAGTYSQCQMTDYNVPMPYGYKVTQDIFEGNARYFLQMTGQNDDTAMEILANNQIMEFRGEDEEGRSVIYRTQAGCQDDALTIDAQVSDASNAESYARVQTSYKKIGQQLHVGIQTQSTEEGNFSMGLICQ